MHPQRVVDVSMHFHVMPMRDVSPVDADKVDREGDSNLYESLRQDPEARCT